MFVRGRAGTDGVTVAQVPEISGSWSALREHCDTWRAAVQAARSRRRGAAEHLGRDAGCL